VLAFGAVAAFGVDLNVAPKGGIVVDTGMFVNSIIQIISGYKSGLMTKSVSICHWLQRATSNSRWVTGVRLEWSFNANISFVLLSGRRKARPQPLQLKIFAKHDTHVSSEVPPSFVYA
jgi:ribosome modulation factor